MACLPPNNWPSVSVLIMELRMSLISSFPKRLRDSALGATLYQLLSGYDPSSSPFRFPFLQLLVPTAPISLATLITQMLELNEDKRPVSMLLVKQALQAVASSPVQKPGLQAPAPLPASVPPAQSQIRQAQRRHGLPSRIRYPLAFFGGLAIEAADFTWLALITSRVDNGQFLINSNPFLFGLALILFLFGIVLAVPLIIHGMVTMAGLKRWGWFIGLLLGSISGAAIIVFPGLALIVFGLFAPRLPTAPASVHHQQQGTLMGRGYTPSHSPLSRGEAHFANRARLSLVDG